MKPDQLYFDVVDESVMTMHFGNILQIKLNLTTPEVIEVTINNGGEYHDVKLNKDEFFWLTNKFQLLYMSMKENG